MFSLYGDLPPVGSSSLIKSITSPVLTPTPNPSSSTVSSASNSSSASCSAPSLSSSIPVPFYLPPSSSSLVSVSPLLNAAGDQHSVQASIFAQAHVPDEYNPLIPNEYEEFVKQRDRRKDEARKKRDIDESFRRVDVDRESVAAPASLPAHSSAPAAKLDLSVSTGEEAWLRRQQLSRPTTITSGSPNTALANNNNNNSATAASRVILLLNMVAAGQVDEELESETADELNSQYGRVLKCSVLEVAHVPADQAVRIFVKFEHIESAQKAVMHLNNRFFGGRRVHADFYPEDKFNKGQLA